MQDANPFRCRLVLASLTLPALQGCRALTV